ncbi:DUF2298 domain-containing protein [Thermoflexus sp.]|uniref:DUF2298 domain-containing protein n=1 Tax=Thermoflexus sp. TaxID=1969742 RepID=UPI002606488D|nr:DUF2298 domain-containing protein [Thermoflexus sp.]MCX7689620.1 DUF2298 domain-containing protein [Thermoflexus sp.]
MPHSSSVSSKTLPQMVPSALWWLLLVLIGASAWPLAFVIFRPLPDRGLALARPLGLLMMGFVWWWGGSLGIFPASPGGAIAAWGLVLGLGLWLAGRSGESPWRWLWAHRGLTLFYELLFAMAFSGWTLFRAYNPEITYTEKPMELAFLNAVVRADRFPPHDPWLSGFAISYYYFGYILLGFLTELSGLPTRLTFNLGVSSWFALTLLAAAGLGWNLWALYRPARRRMAWAVALLSAFWIGLAGNGEAILDLAHACGWIRDPGFWAWLDIPELNEPPPARPWPSCWPPADRVWAWWRASRVVRDYTPDGQHQEVIDEFPQFSFLLGDLHPHVLALPFTLMAIGLALAVFQAAQRFPGLFSLGEWKTLLRFLRDHGPPFWIFPVVFGGLAFLNTWDFPIYTGLLLATWALGAWAAERPPPSWQREVLGLAGGILGLGVLLYLPFYMGFRSQAGGLLPNLYNGTRLPQFLVMFGFQAVGLILLMLVEARRRGVADLGRWGKRVLLGVLGLGLVPVGLLVGLYTLALAIPLPMPGSPVPLEALRPWVYGRLLDGEVIVNGRPFPGSGPWVPMLLAGMGVGAVALWRRRGNVEAFVGLLIGFGAALAWAVEFVFLRDFFGTRMNTVFKFYYQTWVLWSLALAWGMGALWEWGKGARPLLAGWFSSMIALAALYPALMIPIKADFFVRTPTLDGYAYLAQWAPDDLAAIDWLNQHVSGAPVILEAPGWRGISFQPEFGRFAAHTGLPTVLGWAGHEHQWRGSYAEIARREPDLQVLWESPDLEATRMLLEKYNIVYVIIGHTERREFPPQALQKFEQLMDPVFQSGETVIYRRRE